MSETVIRRRSLPDSLRYLAQKLDEPLSDAERAGIALTLNSLADEAEAGQNTLARELAEQHAAMLRAYPDYRGVMDLAAALVLGEDHPHRKQDVSAGPVRPDEEAPR